MITTQTAEQQHGMATEPYRALQHYAVVTLQIELYARNGQRRGLGRRDLFSELVERSERSMFEGF